MSTIELSVIVVNWNTRDLLRECLAALHAADLPAPAETIVVDNASTDGSVDMVRGEFPGVTVLANEDNAGYARANNRALCRARGRYVLLLNSDTRVAPTAIRTLWRFMEEHPAAAACAPRLVTVDGLAQRFAFGGEPTAAYLLRRLLARGLLGRDLHDWACPEAREVDWASGACLLVRREAVDAVGLLDEEMFMYFEDVDWCLRMRRSGWRVYVQPEAVVTHVGGQSVRQNSAARQNYYHGMRRLYAKHYGGVAQALLAAGLWVYRRIVPPEDG